MEMELTSDGTIVIAGSSGRSLYEIESDGDAKTSFGGDGKIVDSGIGGWNPSSDRMGMAIDAEDRPYLIGEDGSEHIRVSRYEPDGDLDTTFGSSGRLDTGITAQFFGMS